MKVQHTNRGRIIRYPSGWYEVVDGNVPRLRVIEGRSSYNEDHLLDVLRSRAEWEQDKFKATLDEAYPVQPTNSLVPAIVVLTFVFVVTFVFFMAM